MKRRLTKEETIATKKGIINRKHRAKEYQLELNYLNDFDQFNKKYADYLADKEEKAKKQKEDILIQTRQSLEKDIEFEQETIKEQEDHLKEGVEIKEMPGVE